MSTQPSEIMCDKEAMKAHISEIIDRLTPDQFEHFTYALEQVANCYLSPSSHGALLIANKTDESQSLVAINANEMQISEMVGFMAEIMNKNHSNSTSGYMN